MKVIKKIYVFILAAVLLTVAGCEKEFLDTRPTDKITTDQMFETYDGALAALNGTYRLFYAFGIEGWTGHSDFGQKAVDLTMDLMGDDMPIASQGYGWFIAEYGYNQHSATKAWPQYLWNLYYNLVNNANNIIANVDKVEATTEEVNYVKGQALTIRAYAYFYLVRLFQHTYVGHENDPGVPIYTAPTSEGKARASVQEVYTQIENDLTDAITMLGNTFSRIHISHINQDVAEGIMARVKLTKEEWSDAVSYAQDARSGGYPLMDSTTYHYAINGQSGFNHVSTSEWMWGFQINSEQSTIYASFFSHFDPTFMTYASLGLQKQINSATYAMIDNPSGDVRAQNFDVTGGETGVPYCQLKFLSYDQATFMGDYLMMRSSEMHLIEAEAQAHIPGNEALAQQAIYDLVSTRDGSYTMPTATGQALLDEIWFQRRIELWGEGFRLLDIKRRKQPLDRTGGNHQPALAREMTLPAESDLFIFQIPEEELDANDNINQEDQNP